MSKFAEEKPQILRHPRTFPALLAQKVLGRSGKSLF
jgi:hypothetical protein